MEKNMYKDKVNLVYSGNKFKYREITSKKNTEYQPVVNFKKENDKLYTIIMVDPDAPIAKENNAEYLHWLIVNISNKNDNGDVINKYIGPNPPKGTGTHHYYICVFVQNNIIKKLKKFDRTKFKKKNL